MIGKRHCKNMEYYLLKLKHDGHSESLSPSPCVLGLCDRRLENKQSGEVQLVIVTAVKSSRREAAQSLQLGFMIPTDVFALQN